MPLLHYISVVICLCTIMTMTKGNILDRQGDVEIGDNGKNISLLDRRKRMPGCDFVCRCWDEVDDSTMERNLPENCIYFNEEILCYNFLRSSGDITQDAEECTRYIADYGLADVNSALLLDRIAELARSDSISDRYWVRVDSSLQNIPLTTGQCSSYKDDFTINDNECTYLQIKNDEYEVRKRMCRDATADDGYICQGRLEPTRDTPTTSMDKIFTTSVVTTTKGKMTSESSFKQQPEQNDSKTLDAVIPVSIALAVAVVCIAVLVAIILLKRRTPDDSVSGTNTPSEPEKHDPVINRVNEQNYADNSSNINQSSKYETSLPGDYAYLGENVSKDHGPDHSPDYCAVEGDVYNLQYEYPMLPVSVDSSNAESLLNDPSYDSLGPHYDVLNREEDGKQEPAAYVDLENEKETPEDEYSYAYYTDLIK